jgi:hypothetical protein
LAGRSPKRVGTTPSVLRSENRLVDENRCAIHNWGQRNSWRRLGYQFPDLALAINGARGAMDCPNCPACPPHQILGSS